MTQLAVLKRQVKTRLVKDQDTGKLCLQIYDAKNAATIPLPENLAAGDTKQIQEFAAKVVPEMMDGLLKLRLEENKKIRRKATELCSR